MPFDVFIGFANDIDGAVVNEFSFPNEIDRGLFVIAVCDVFVVAVCAVNWCGAALNASRFVVVVVVLLYNGFANAVRGSIVLFVVGAFANVFCCCWRYGCWGRGGV